MCGTIDAKRAPESCANSPGALTETSWLEGASALTHSMARPTGDESPPALFPGFDVPTAPPIDPGLSADRRRTLRQRAAVEAGRHPLTGGRLSDDPSAKCGNCRFRQLILHHDRTYPKCMWIPTSTDARELESARWMPPRFSHSAASDVRAWWPGCSEHEWGDPKLSPDAARSGPP
jgi:hypothetical protein